MIKIKGLFQLYLKLVLLFLTIIFIVTAAYSQRTKTSQAAGEQVKSEKGLKDNRYFFYFINSSITNFGSEEEKKLFKEAIQRDMLAQLLFMRMHFKDAYIEVRKSQKILVDLYGMTLRRDIQMSKNLLDEAAPAGIHSKDNRAMSYLQLGYRDVKSAHINMIMGDNFRESLYSMRLLQYVKSVKLAKTSKRFAFLSMIETATPRVEKRPHQHLSFQEIDKKISGIVDTGRVEYYRNIHKDNYYLSKDNKSYYDTIWENPAIQDLEDYKKYLNDSETQTDTVK